MGVHTTRRYCNKAPPTTTTANKAKLKIIVRQVEDNSSNYEEEAYYANTNARANADASSDELLGGGATTDIANISSGSGTKCDATDDAADCGGYDCTDRQEDYWLPSTSYKAKRHIGKSAQSVLSSLRDKLLLLLTSVSHFVFTFWNALLASRLKFKKNKALVIGSHQSPNTFCANLPQHSTEYSFEEEVSFQEIINSSNKMTIEVSDTMTANIVNPSEEQDLLASSDNLYGSSSGSDHEDSEVIFDEDQNQKIMSMKVKNAHHHRLSATSGGGGGLPVLRLNSESFEDSNLQILLQNSNNGSSSEGDSDLLFEEDDGTSSTTSSSAGEKDHEDSGRRDQDSCSDYCSGSGSLSGSPVPDLHHHLENLDRRHQQEIESASSQLIRRDSDTSSSDSSSVNEDQDTNGKKNKASAASAAGNGEVGPELKAKIISQVESMFSDEHLEKDGFLLKHVRRRSDGFVSLKLVAGLRKVKQLSREFSTVLVALMESEKLEVNSEGTKIRRKEPLTSLLKSLPIKQAKKEKSEKDQQNQNQGSSNSSADEQQQNISVMRSSNQTNKENGRNNGIKNGRNAPAVYNNNGGISNNNRKNSNGQQQYPNKVSTSRKSSNASTASSNNPNSRNGSFSSGTGTGGGRPHPADLFRHMMTSTSSGEDSPQVNRRRGGSLPINTTTTTGHRGSIGGHNNLSPNSSPPSNVPVGFLRPKSNSYCEGTTTNQQATSTGMSPWLLKRKASAVSSRSSNGDIVISGVIRQPRGPDGTNGFASGYRELILQDRLLTSVSECSTTFSA